MGAIESKTSQYFESKDSQKAPKNPLKTESQTISCIGLNAACMMMGSCFVGNDCLMTVIEIREMSVRCGERARKQEVHNTRRFCTSLPGIVVEAAAVKDLDCRGTGLTYFGAKQFFFPAN